MKHLAERIWERLGAVKTLSLVATSRATEGTGWNGEARGTVEVQRPASDCFHFVESGAWIVPASPRLNFSNTYRWTLRGARIRLEHLRFGVERPVHLVDLVVATAEQMTSENPHQCAADLYSASLDLGKDLKLSWSVTGPRKRDRIDCHYFAEESEKINAFTEVSRRFIAPALRL